MKSSISRFRLQEGRQCTAKLADRNQPSHSGSASAPDQQRTLTARAITRASRVSETGDCAVIAIFAHGARGIASVGLQRSMLLV